MVHIDGMQQQEPSASCSSASSIPTLAFSDQTRYWTLHMLVPLGLLLGMCALQVGFWLILQGGSIWTGYIANAVVWCAAFPLWRSTKRRWWSHRAAPDVALCVGMVAATIGFFHVANGLPDTTYCGLVQAHNSLTCWISYSSQMAFWFSGLFYVPLSVLVLISAVRFQREAHSSSRQLLLGVAVVFALCLVGLLIWVFLHIAPPT